MRDLSRDQFEQRLKVINLQNRLKSQTNNVTDGNNENQQTSRQPQDTQKIKSDSISRNHSTNKPETKSQKINKKESTPIKENRFKRQKHKQGKLESTQCVS